MKRFLFLTVIAIGAIALAFIAGCSEDENPTGGGTGGDTTTAEFAFASQELGEEGLDGIDLTFALSFSLLDSIPGGVVSRRGERNFSLQQDSSGGGDVLIQNLTYTYAYTGGWHVFAYNAVAIEPDSTDTIDVSGTDSIQITDQGVPQQTVPLISDGIKIRNHFGLTTRVKLDTVSSEHSLDFTGNVMADTGSVTINGSGSEAISTSYSEGQVECDLDISNNITISSVVIQNGGGDCPTSGSLTANATVTLACQGSGLDSLNVNGAWTVTWTFTGTTEHVTFNDGTTTWSVTRECGSGDMGNPTDTMFVSDMLNDGELLDNVFRSVDVSLALLDSIPGGVARQSGPMHSLQGGMEPILVITSPGVYTYSTTNWHIFTGFQLLVIDTVFDDTTTVTGTDSVQIIVNGAPVQIVPSFDSLGGLNVRAHVTWSNNSGAENGSLDHSVDVSVAPAGADTIITITATTHDTISVNDMDMGYGCSKVIGLSQTVTGLQINVAMTSNDCPVAGSMSATATIDAFCIQQGQFGDDTLDFNGTVSITATVNANQSITFSYDDGTVAWSGTEPCVPSGITRHSSWSIRD